MGARERSLPQLRPPVPARTPTGSTLGPSSPGCPGQSNGPHPRIRGLDPARSSPSSSPSKYQLEFGGPRGSGGCRHPFSLQLGKVWPDLEGSQEARILASIARRDQQEAQEPDSRTWDGRWPGGAGTERLGLPLGLGVRWLEEARILRTLPSSVSFANVPHLGLSSVPPFFCTLSGPYKTLSFPSSGGGVPWNSA